MRAVAVFPAEKRAGLVDHPAPRIERDTEARVRMLEVGICGTDREIAHFEYGLPPPGSPYLVIGHESLAEVVEIGSAVRRVRVGDLVVLMVRRPCGRPDCPACRVGRQDFCLTGEFTERGIKERHGYMTEEVVDEEVYMHVVPPELRDVAVLVEPLTIAEKALIEVGNVQSRLPWLRDDECRAELGTHEVALVLGAGPVGLLGMLALRVRAFDTWVYSREDAASPEAKLVEAAGAHYLSSLDTPIESLRRRIGNIDLVYEATGAATVAFAALGALGVNGVFIFTGVPGRKGPISFDASRVMRDLVLGNQIFYGTVNAGPDAFHAAIEDLGSAHRRWPEVVRGIISHRHAPEDFTVPLLTPPPGIKQVIRFAEPAARGSDEVRSS